MGGLTSDGESRRQNYRFFICLQNWLNVTWATQPYIWILRNILRKDLSAPVLLRKKTGKKNHLMPKPGALESFAQNPLT